MTLEHHIEELRAELRNCWDREERHEIEAELEVAVAELNIWINELTQDLRGEKPPF
ncbi:MULTISPECIES: hypothetical protein [Agrobacterium]|uniref:hypothetical protein n=1 Tax=Agrobacterium TaxID=357 RepID=UPI001C6E74D6|nr:MULTISPECIES: hypothetical protein [Agrobacterium]MBW9075039.1 hypothetical protein [Agrobacterium deltaense]MCZ7889585.1 hypothetical protein [Agrobacterium salinitolerans]UNZ54124.1 hypothetical protein MLE07_24900 [Agrobacterium tumefaciens]